MDALPEALRRCRASVSPEVKNRLRDWLAGPGARLTIESPEPLGAFCLSGRHVGELTPDSMRALREDTELRALVSETAPRRFELLCDDTFASRTEAMRHLTDRLEALGLNQRRRNELLDIFDEDGTVLAVAERAAFRRLGLPTAAVRAAALTPDGRILMQKRSRLKQVGPGRWDNLASGMVSAGEAYPQAMSRELSEEAGLDMPPSALAPEPSLCFSSSIAVRYGWMREHSVTFRVIVPEGFEPFNRDGEVACFEAFTPETLLPLILADKCMPEAAVAVALELTAEN